MYSASAALTLTERQERTHLGSNGEALGAGVDGGSARHLDLVLDADKGVVLGNTCATLHQHESTRRANCERMGRTLRSARSSGLDLSNTESDDEVGNSGAARRNRR